MLQRAAVRFHFPGVHFFSLLVKRAFSLLFLATFAFAGEPKPRLLPPLVFHASGRRIVIPQRNAEGPYDFTQHSCNGYTIETSTLHAAIHRGRTLYLVYSCAGNSRGPEARLKRCGAGWEHQINWIAIRRGIVVDFQQSDVESCWSDIFGRVEGWRGAKLSWMSGDAQSNSYYSFDSTDPESGLQFEKYETLPRP